MFNTKATRDFIVEQIREALKTTFNRRPSNLKKGDVVQTIAFTQFVPDSAPKTCMANLAKGLINLSFTFYNEGSLFLVIDEPLSENHQVSVMCLTSGHTGWIDTRSLKAYE